MRDRQSGSMVSLAIASVAVSAAISVPATRASAQAQVASSTAVKTPWGEPDLQGIWTPAFDTPLQRPAKYADQEFFTEAQRAEIDKDRAMIVERRRARKDTGVGDADVTVGMSLNPVGARTSLIVDPPDGRMPPLTAEAE